MTSQAPQRHLALYRLSSRGLNSVRSSAAAPTMTLHFKRLSIISIYSSSNASRYCRSSARSSFPMAFPLHREATMPVKLPP